MQVQKCHISLSNPCGEHIRSNNLVAFMLLIQVQKCKLSLSNAHVYYTPGVTVELTINAGSKMPSFFVQSMWRMH